MPYPYALSAPAAPYYLRITFGATRTVLDVLPAPPLSRVLGRAVTEGWLHDDAHGEVHALGPVPTLDDARAFARAWMPGADEARPGEGGSGGGLLRFVEARSGRPLAA